MAFLHARAWLIAVLSILVVVPCLWLPRIEAGDPGSHVYNAWLRRLVEQGQAPGLYFGPQWNNMFLDVGLDWVAKLVGLPAAEKYVLPICVLIFFWGCFALVFPGCQMEGRHYVVQPGDLPMYQIYRPLEDPDTLQIRELRAGEENGPDGVQFTSPCMSSQRAFAKSPR